MLVATQKRDAPARGARADAWRMERKSSTSRQPRSGSTPTTCGASPIEATPIFRRRRDAGSRRTRCEDVVRCACEGRSRVEAANRRQTDRAYVRQPHPQLASEFVLSTPAMLAAAQMTGSARTDSSPEPGLAHGRC